MFFNRKKKLLPEHAGDSELRPQAVGELYRIEFDMLLKGSVYKRRNGEVKQMGVTVNGATKLVTSGDLVDRDTLNALIAAGAIRPPRGDARRDAATAPPEQKLPQRPSNESLGLSKPQSAAQKSALPGDSRSKSGDPSQATSKKDREPAV